MFYIDINIIFYNIVFNIFLYPREVKFLGYFLKYLFNSLILARAFYFIVNFKDFSLSTYKNIGPSLEGKEP